MAPRDDQPARRLPVGAEVQPGGGVHFRVWAPRRTRVAVELASEQSPPASLELKAEPGGYFSGYSPTATAGARYGFRLDHESKLYPDPASRFQPDGPHGPSQVVDPHAFRWTDRQWRGLKPRGQVLYELHIGTFTPVGSWAAAAEHLPDLADVGITAVEVLPVSDFSGRFGWLRFYASSLSGRRYPFLGRHLAAFRPTGPFAGIF